MVKLTVRLNSDWTRKIADFTYVTKRSIGISTLAENPDQIIQDQLYWCCRDNNSLTACANDVVRTLNSYLFGDYACSVTNTSPAYAWKTYDGNDSYNKILIDCYVPWTLVWVSRLQQIFETQYHIDNMNRLKGSQDMSGHVRLFPLYELWQWWKSFSEF